MSIKRNTQKMQTVKADFDFEVKQTGEATFIEGFANKNVVDRGSEIIDPEAWDLENFMKNPVILFNHGLDPVFGGTPVGTATLVKPTEEGLYLKVRMSNSKSPLITMVRDLVEEKILKAFSVGFESKEAEVEERDGKDVRVIKSAELFETSIVGIPMNQDSLFELSGKMLKGKTLDQVELMVCEKKGALVAGAVHDKIFQLMKAGEFDREKALDSIASLAEIDISELKEILAGDITPVPIPVLEAVSEVLGLKVDDLKALDDGDKTLDEFLKDSKLFGNDDKEDEDDEDDDEDEEESKQTDTDDCVKEKIRELLAEGMDQEQAVAVALSKCSEDGKAAPSKDELKELLEFADSLLEEKQAGEGTEDEPEPTVAIQTEPDATDFGNPHLEQAKQTNVMLGTVVSKLDMLIDVLSANINNRNTENNDEEMVENDGEEKGYLDNYRNRLENIRQRLKNLS